MSKLQSIPQLSESEHQIALMEWAAWSVKDYPDLHWLIHVPLGEYRHKKTAALLKRLGTKRGFPDLLLLTPRGKYHALIIELKRVSGGKVSPAQRGWIDYLNSQEYKAVVCRGWQEARQVIIEYLNLPKDGKGNE